MLKKLNMESFIKKLFGIKSTDYNELIENGAYIVDVRNPGEFNSGNIMGSTNIPLDKIKSKLKEMKKNNKVVIFCCVSGARSAKATSIARSIGIESYNGGAWSSLYRKLNH
jgi:rhodanese-related sulfurtransferase